MSHRSRATRAHRAPVRQPEPFPLGEAFSFDAGTRAQRRSVAERLAACWPLSSLVTAAVTESLPVPLAHLFVTGCGPAPVVLADPAGYYFHPTTYRTARAAGRALAALRRRRQDWTRGAKGRAVVLDLSAGLAIMETGFLPGAKRHAGRESHAPGEMAPSFWRLPDAWHKGLGRLIPVPDVYDDPEAHARDDAAAQAAWHRTCARSIRSFWVRLPPHRRAAALAELACGADALDVADLADLAIEGEGSPTDYASPLAPVWLRLRGVQLERVQNAESAHRRQSVTAGELPPEPTLEQLVRHPSGIGWHHPPAPLPASPAASA